jgi:hypothetical protein
VISADEIPKALASLLLQGFLNSWLLYHLLVRTIELLVLCRSVIDYSNILKVKINIA